MSECPVGFYNEIGNCSSCDTICRTCDGPDDNNCLSCNDIKVFHLNQVISKNLNNIFNLNYSILVFR